ncbi:MAG: FAD-binding protein [bacterium]
MIEIVADRCSGCGECVKLCPFGVIRVEERLAVIQPGCTLCSACAQICPLEAVRIERGEVKVDLSEYRDVWVFVETLNSRVRQATFELLGKARELATDLEQRVCAVLLGNGVGHLCAPLTHHGAETVYLAQGSALEHYSTDGFFSVLTGLITKYKPSIVLYPATHTGRDLAPRVAAALGTGLTADCTELSIQDGNLIQTRPAFGGNIMAEIVSPHTRPQMATVRPNVMKKLKPMPERTPQIISVPIQLEKKGIRTVLKEAIKTTAPGARRIDEADVIVAGGRGVGAGDGFKMLEELAQALGGVVGASRAAVELGLKPKSAQIGQSGITVSPKLYIACGISGSIQHQVGMRSSETIVAINTDPGAPIFDLAKYGVVGDLFEVVPRLTEQIREFKSKA